MDNLQPFRTKISGAELFSFFEKVKLRSPSPQDLVFVCIGTDRSTGDSLGPLVGTFLEELGFQYVIGTLKNPCDASNIVERLTQLPVGKLVVAIDACLGRPASVGYYQVSNQPLYPGESVGKRLPAVGDFSVAAIVNVDGNKKYWILQNTSLHHVVSMAKEILSAVQAAWPTV